MTKVKHTYSVISRYKGWIIKGCDTCGYNKHTKLICWDRNITKQMVIDAVKRTALK